MPINEKLADRVRTRLGARKGLTEKRMFGGVAFLLGGKMCCGVHGDDLIVRLDPAETDKALREPHVRVFDMTGRPMKGWVLVGPGGTTGEAALTAWVDRAVRCAAALPAKRR